MAKENIQNQLETLEQEFQEAARKLDLPSLQTKMQDLQQQMSGVDFWKDNQKAQTVVEQYQQLKAQVTPWLELQENLKEIRELHALADVALESEITAQLDRISQQFSRQKRDLLFDGPYDTHGAIISIHAGAGGTDAQDWTQMLFTMYSRWVEKAGGKLEVLDQSSGEEAGLKRVVCVVSLPYAYGKLQSEHGVHRLVRLSPFNADNLRQTSFAKVEVLPKIDTPKEVEIDKKDLKIDVFRSGGHGGQSVNTTDSAIRVTHIPSGIQVAIQNERSQLQNKETALTILRSKLARLQADQHQSSLEKIKGPNQSAEWGNQIRSYVLHPYRMVKDLRTKYETSDVDAVLKGELDPFIAAWLEERKTKRANG